MQSLRKIALFALCAVVLVGAFGISCVSASDSAFPVPIGPDSLWNANSMYSIWPTLEFKALVNRNGESGATRYVSPSSEYPVYAFAYYNSITQNDFVCFCSPGHAVTYRAIYTNQWYTYTETLNSFDSASGLYFGSEGNLYVQPYSVDPSLPYYSDRASGLLAVAASLESVPSSLVMTIPAGYALRFFSSDNIDLNAFTLSVSNTWDFPQLSGSSSRYNGARYGLYTDESIIQGASADRGSFVPWVAQNANLFGRASSYSYTHSFTDYTVYPSYSYVITNPLYAVTGQQPEERYHENGAIALSLDLERLGTVSYQLIALRAELSADSGVFTYNNVFDPASGLITGTIVSGSGDDPDDVDFGSPTPGGGNADQPPLSENTTIFGLLNTLVNYFTGFFNSAINAIQSLVSQGQSFMQVIATMFSWLPVEVSSVIVAGFVILLIVGVIKVLWR